MTDAKKEIDAKLVAWLAALSEKSAKPLTPYQHVAAALMSHPQAIELLYKTFVNDDPAIGTAQMISDICARVEKKIGKALT